MSSVSPNETLARVAEEIPHECRVHMIVIGSLAVGYHFFAADREMFIQTKDIDSVVRPRSTAVKSAQEIAKKLLESGWTHRTEGDFSKPGTEDTPTEELPAVRLEPPSLDGWFLELLTEPEGNSGEKPAWLRVRLANGHYGLPSFAFLRISTYLPLETEFGIYCARPEMMALANLLEHPVIGTGTMSGPIAGRRIKRSNKDLGRVVAIAYLANEGTEAWVESWAEALRTLYPESWKDKARAVGSGLRALLASEGDMEEALHTCNNGILAGKQIRLEPFQIAAQRLLQTVIEPIESGAV